MIEDSLPYVSASFPATTHAVSAGGVAAVAMDLARAFRNARARGSLWPQIYPTWEAATRAARDYDDVFLTGVRIARMQARAHLAQPLPLQHPLFNAACGLGGDFTMTDFGGATGDYGVALALSFPKVRSTVVETPSMVAAMPVRTGVTFATTMPARCDLFFSSGTLQCIANPYEVLAQGFASARRAVLLTRNNFCDREIFRVQRSWLSKNGAGPMPVRDRIITYANRTIQEARVRAIAQRHGFTLAQITPDDSGVLRHRGEVYGGDLLFVRH